MNKMSSSAAWVGLYLGLLLLHNLLAAAFTWPALKRQQSRDAMAYARMSARTVAEAHYNYYDSGYYKFRELVGEVMRMNPDLRNLYLIDVQGRVLFDSREFEQGKPERPATVDSPELLAAVKGLDLTCWMVKGEDGTRLLDIVVPYLEEWGRHRVSVRYLVDYRPWGDIWKGLWARILLAGLISLVLGGGVIALVAGRMARPGAGLRPEEGKA